MTLNASVHGPSTGARSHPRRLSASTRHAIAARRRGYSPSKGKHFLAFQQRIDRELLSHRVISANHSARWKAVRRTLRG